MATDDLPLPPTFAALSTWAGAGQVVRADPRELATWRLPQVHKAALISCGVPLIEDLVDVASFAAEPTQYRLAERHSALPAFKCAYVAEPGTGHVREIVLPTEEGTFVNSSIIHWLRSLDLVGSWLSNSTAIQRWDEDEEAEKTALAELAALLQQIKTLDPPAYGDGDHRTHFWPGTLDRWLY